MSAVFFFTVKSRALVAWLISGTPKLSTLIVANEDALCARRIMLEFISFSLEALNCAGFCDTLLFFTVFFAFTNTFLDNFHKSGKVRDYTFYVFNLNMISNASAFRQT